MRVTACPRLPDGDCVFISDGWIVACAKSRRHRCWHDAIGNRRSLRFSCVRRALGFETKKQLEFRNREGANVGDDLGVDSMLKRGLVPILSIRDAFLKAPIARTSHDSYIWESVLLLDL